MTTIYSICVAHANDKVDHDRGVAVSGQLILINGLASFVGPIIGAKAMAVAVWQGC